MALEDQRDELRRDFSSEDRTALLRVSEDLRKIEQEMREQGISTEQALIDANKILLSPPPFAVSLIGRDRELAAYQKTLQQNQGLVLVGRAGIGKSVLGAALARRLASDDEHIFWLRFVSGLNTDVESVLWSLAVFLAQLGYDEPWRVFTIEQTRMDQSDRLSASVKMGLISAGLQEHATVLCFDDCHHLQDKELAASQEMSPILALLSDLVKQAKDYRVILMTRKQLPGMGEIPQEIVMGLSAQDSGNLVSNLAPVWSPEFNPMLHQYLKGNPQLLTMFAAILAHAPAAHDSIAKTLETLEDSRVGDYLNTELWAQLSESERLVLQVVSVFQQDAPEAALESILEERRVTGIQSLLRGMRRTGVVIYSRSEQEGGQSRYSLHETLKKFCYNLLDLKPQQKLHKLIGSYLVQTDPLEAVYHFFKASKHNRGLKTLIAHKRTLLESGQISAALHMIETLNQKMFDEHLNRWVAVCELRGEWLQVIGEYEKAVTDLEKALHLATTLKLDIVHRARLNRMMGVALHYQARFEEAQTRLKRAGSLLKEQTDQQETGIIYYWIARINFMMGEYPVAKEMALRSLADLEQAWQNLERGEITRKEIVENRSWQIRVYNTLGATSSQLGDHESGKEYFDQAKQIITNNDLDNTPEAVQIYISLGHLEFIKGEYDECITLREKALQIATRLGLTRFIIQSSYALGVVWMQLTKWDQAKYYLTEALKDAKRTGDIPYRFLSLMAIGNVFHKTGDWEMAIKFFLDGLQFAQNKHLRFEQIEALSHLGQAFRDMPGEENWKKGLDYLEQAWELAHIPDELEEKDVITYFDVEILASRAEIKARLGLDGALVDAQGAHTEAANTQDNYLISNAHTAWGIVCTLSGSDNWHKQEAEKHFKKAIQAIEEIDDRYESGRVELRFGEMYVYSEDYDQAREHLDKAIEIFEGIDSIRFLEMARQAKNDLPPQP